MAGSTYEFEGAGGMAVSSVGTAENTVARKPTDGASLAKNFDSFLKLLTTQLQYQDPLSPLDSTQFVTQLVQFSQVEQAIKTNTTLDSLIGLQRDAQTAYAVGYIGKSVEVKGDKATYSGAPLKFSYTLPNRSANTVVTIADPQGRPVRTLSGELTAGRHEVSWDGKDDLGRNAAAGTYRLIVSAVNNEGKPIPATTSLIGLVEAVRTEQNKVLISVAGQDVPFADVLSVRQPSGS
jgi:flagellar basal-body rod modification protein FlgD